MIAVTCPPRERLLAYVRGQLDLALHDTVDIHLDDCSACRMAVESLDCETPAPFDVLRLPARDGVVEDPAYRRLVDRVKAIVPGSSLPQEAVWDVGSVLGNYELLHPIGGGGMGRVYKARHRRMNRIVALKVLAPELLRSAEARTRFQREVEAAARVTSPHVVAAYDADEANGRDFLIMEFVEGENLADLVKRAGPLAEMRALEYALQAARGLADAHAAGLIHRDVKPANLLLDRQGTVKLLDLGLARALIGDESSSLLTQTNTAMGTPAFMAPEQAADTRQADARSDVYSLGCTLYYLLTGKAPFEGATGLEVVLAHREKPIPPVPESSPGVAGFLRSAMAKQPADRFPTMTAVVAELESVLDHKPSVPLERRRRVNAPAVRWAVAAAVVVAAGALSWAFIGPDQPKTAPRPIVADAELVPASTRDEEEFAAAAGAERRQHAEAFLHDKTDTARRFLSLHRLVASGVVAQTVKADADRQAVRRERVASILRRTAETGARFRTLPRLALECALPRSPRIEMKLIAAGEFSIGSPKTDPAARPDEKPQTLVKITKPFQLGVSKITQEQFAEVMGTNPSIFTPRTHPELKDTRQHPVETVNWLDAVRFCNRLSVRQGLEPYYKIDGERVLIRGGTGYRLPTEAEWEYACRAGTSTRWFFGDDAKDLGDFAWFAGNAGGVTHPIKLKKANPWGLNDMYGNVSEWCWDRYQPNAFATNPESDPVGPGIGEARVIRGGAWNSRDGQLRSASRLALGSMYGAEGSPNHVGFRVARNVEP